MAAPDKETLLDFESQFDAGLLLAFAPLEADPYGLTLYAQQVEGVMTTPRLEFTFSLGRPAGPGNEIQFRSGNQIMAVAYEFTLGFHIVTDRTKTDISAAQIRGAFRSLMTLTGDDAIFSTTALPYLTILTLNETSATRGLLSGPENEKYLDSWMSQWNGIFQINQDAWPA